ncbi:MAG: autotransporter strand-loop-strand O-heptosyltransferase [Methylococcales bacterium]
MRNAIMTLPSKPKKLHLPANQTANACSFNFVDGAFVEITGNLKEAYLVQFIDSRYNKIIHQAQIHNNCWVRTARQYFTPWTIKVYRAKDQQLLFTHHYNCQQQRVYIALESKALGDTLAWLHSAEEFRVKHRCELICSTFMNSLFKDQYPDLQFVEPGETVHNLYAMYRIGWFYLKNGAIDLNKNVYNFRLQALGETAADILGLPYTAARPRLQAPDLGKPMRENFVCIAVHSTAQAKYWNNPTGWAEVAQYLRQRGYTVMLLSREGMHYMGNHAPDGVIPVPPGPITTIINYLRYAKLFIGIGSGLSWLSWAVGCKTCLISGFSYPYTEVDDLIRISPDNSHCSGCFNRYALDAGDWNWCPDHKNSPSSYECTHSITGQQVINAIAHYLD